MYNYEIWDKKSPINGVSADKMLKAIPHSNEDIYLLKDGEVVNLIYPSSFSPYEADTVEERARLHCEALNTQNNESEEQQNG